MSGGVEKWDGSPLYFKNLIKTTPPSKRFGSFWDCGNRWMGSIRRIQPYSDTPPTPSDYLKGVDEMDKRDLGQRVKSLREQNNLTQKELAKSAGITRNYISSIETGRYSPSLETLQKIANALEVTVLNILDNRVESMESRVDNERARLHNLFSDIPENQLEVVEGLIIQVARLRILLDDNWRDILENGEYEKFSQSKDQKPYDRKRPIVENYDNRDKTYKDIIKQLTEMLPTQDGRNKTYKDKLLGR